MDQNVNAVEAFIKRWQGAGGSEFMSVVMWLCDSLGF